jgi:hypothetical protein
MAGFGHHVVRDSAVPTLGRARPAGVRHDEATFSFRRYCYVKARIGGRSSRKPIASTVSGVGMSPRYCCFANGNAVILASLDQARLFLASVRELSKDPIVRVDPVCGQPGERQLRFERRAGSARGHA